MKESLEDYTRVMRRRYARRTGKQARSALLEGYCRSSGLERKHVIKVLRGQRRRGATGAAKGARSTYGGEDITVLKGMIREALMGGVLRFSVRDIRDCGGARISLMTG